VNRKGVDKKGYYQNTFFKGEKADPSKPFDFRQVFYQQDKVVAKPHCQGCEKDWKDC
jgi:hypothetical protein